MYWTDYVADKIYSSDLSGENVEVIVDTQLDVPGTKLDDMYIVSCTLCYLNGCLLVP